MKKTIYSLLLAVSMLLCATICLAAEENPYLIYKNNDFEDHRIGEVPGSFIYHWSQGMGFYDEEEMRLEAIKDIRIVNLEKDGNANNKAVRLEPDLDSPEYNVDANDGITNADGSDRKYLSTARTIFTYYPIKEKGVISFSVMVEDPTKTKNIKLGRNAIYYRHINIVNNEDPKNDDTRYIKDNWKPFIIISNGKAYYSDGSIRIELGTVEARKWYDIDFAFDIPAGTADVYFNGTKKEVKLPANTVNIYEVRFDLTQSAGDVWYIDDLSIYEADSIVEDAVLDAQWKRYTDSSFYTGYEFESSIASNYDYMAFLKCDGKRFTIVNTNRFFDGSRTVTLGATLHYNDEGILMAPVYDIAKALGAEADIDPDTGRVTMTYDGRTMTVTPGDANYYSDGKVGKMRCPVSMVNDVACMQLEVLLSLFDKSYTQQKDILWIDTPTEFDWHMPLTKNGTELMGTNASSIEDNLYRRILHVALYERPTDAELDAVILKGVHPRIEFTKESAEIIKKRIVPGAEDYDRDLKVVVEELISDADNYLDPNHKNYVTDYTYGSPTDSRPSYESIYAPIQKWSFAYLMSDDETAKAKYKNALLHHLTYLCDPEQFPSFHFDKHSALPTGSTLAYSFAYAYDWVDWSQEQREMIEAACRRNIMEHALHVYNCSLQQYHHVICYDKGNQALITNGGVLMLAMAMYEHDPEFYQDVIRGALRATEGGTISYFPNGEYEEGISYWRYAADYLPRVVKGLQTSMGTDWGITDVPGVLKTGEFPFMMQGATYAYAFGDGQSERAFVHLLTFCADQTNNKTLAEFRKRNGAWTSPATVDVANWVFDTAGYNEGPAAIYNEDIYNVINATVVMKSGWNSSDTSVAFHGGSNNDPHGHVDIGSFQFDMSGIRFGMDVERENYELRDTGAYDRNTATNYPEGYSFTGGHYYRQKGEGHNTVVANRSVTNKLQPSNSKSYDMVLSAGSAFTDMSFGDDVSYAILNMTDTNSLYNCAVRGIKLDKENDIIYVQDDFVASEATDFLWSMHTKATIEVSADGKSAVLTSGTKQIKVTILYDNGCDFGFEILPAEFDETYGKTLKPKIETANTGINKLAIRTAVGENIRHFRLTVAIQPYESTVVPQHIPIELWGSK